MYLELTRRCEPGCGACREAAATAELPPALVTRALVGARALALGSIEAIGGEPILARSFDTLLLGCAEAGLRLAVTSHGWHAESYARALRPLRAQLTRVRLPLRGHLAERHDRRAAEPGSFARITSAIERYRSADLPVLVRHPLTRESMPELAELGRLLASLGAGLELFAPHELAGTAEAWDCHERAQDLLVSELAALKRLLSERLELEPSIGHGQLYSYCSNFTALDRVMVKRDGEVWFCHRANADEPGAVLGTLTNEDLGVLLARHPGQVAKVWSARLRALACVAPGVRDGCQDCRRARRGELASGSA